MPIPCPSARCSGGGGGPTDPCPGCVQVTINVQVVDSDAGVPIPNAEVVVYALVDGVVTEVASGSTDSNGDVSFVLDPSYCEMDGTVAAAALCYQQNSVNLLPISCTTDVGIGLEPDPLCVEVTGLCGCPADEPVYYPPELTLTLGNHPALGSYAGQAYTLEYDGAFNYRLQGCPAPPGGPYCLPTDPATCPDYGFSGKIRGINADIYICINDSDLTVRLWSSTGAGSPACGVGYLRSELTGSLGGAPYVPCWSREPGGSFTYSFGGYTVGTISY